MQTVPFNGATTDRLIRATSSFTSSAIRGRRLLILCYHRVLQQPDVLLPDTVDAAAFEEHMSVLSRCYRPLPLREAVQQMHEGGLPRRAVCVTFDDGYSDNYHVALPILTKYRIPATLFVATGYLDGGRMWNDTVREAIRRTSEDCLSLPEIGLPVLRLDTDADRQAAASKIVLTLRRMPTEQRARHSEALADTIGAELPDNLMLTANELKMLHDSGVEIGAHTVTHPILTRLSNESAITEIRRSRGLLTEMLGTEIPGFAYPNGQPGVDFDRSHVRAVANAGFAYAVTTARGSSSKSTDRYQLPRLDPWLRDPVRFGLRLALEHASPPSRLV